MTDQDPLQKKTIFLQWQFQFLTLPIDNHEIHLWVALPDYLNDPSLLHYCHSILSDHEQKQQQRFYFPQHQHQYLITRAMVRCLIAQYLDLEPQNLIFTKNPHGKPFIIPSQNHLNLKFNLSHTDGIIACAINLNEDIGIDIESQNRQIDLKLANRFFSPDETRWILEHPSPATQQKRFLELWTTLEAKVKCSGRGLI